MCAQKATFKDKFAVDETSGSFVYKADACAHRFDDITRNEMDNTNSENWLRTGHFGKQAYHNEMRTISLAYTIMKTLGMDKLGNVDLETFVAVHKEVLWNA